MSYCVELKGGSPWGFRLQGGRDIGEKLKIGKVSILKKI